MRPTASHRAAPCLPGIALALGGADIRSLKLRWQRSRYTQLSRRKAYAWRTLEGPTLFPARDVQVTDMITAAHGANPSGTGQSVCSDSLHTPLRDFLRTETGSSLGLVVAVLAAHRGSR